MKHPYQPACSCKRCARETARRQSQAAADPRRDHAARAHHRRRRAHSEDRRAVALMRAWDHNVDDLSEWA